MAQNPGGHSGAEPTAPGPSEPTGTPTTAARPRATARTAAAAAPGPTITRPKAPPEGVKKAGPSPKAQAKAARKAAHAASRAPAAAAAPAMSRGGNAKRLHDWHARAARRAGLPKLALSADEAAELDEAIAKFNELTGFAPSGPFFDWMGIIWTFGSIYLGRIDEIMARCRQLFGTSAPARPGPTTAQVSAMAAEPAPTPVPGPPRVPPRPIPTVPSAPMPAHNGHAAPPLVPPGGTISAAAEQILGLNQGRAGRAAEGATPSLPGVPVTTLEERTGEL